MRRGARTARPRAAGARREPPRIAPMLAKLGAMPRDGRSYAYEVKWDGYRAVASFDGARLRLTSRNGNDLTPRFPEVAPLERVLAAPVVLDGELVALDREGRPSFSAIQTRMPHLIEKAEWTAAMSKGVSIVFMLFDVLWLNGESVMGLPYVKRRERLADLRLDGPTWKTPPYTLDGDTLWSFVTREGLEGLVAKRLDSAYLPGDRSDAWTKVKNNRREEFIIGGWTEDAGQLDGLLLGEQLGEVLRFVGVVRRGLAAREAKLLKSALEIEAVARSPFDRNPGEEGQRFCNPRLLAEVSYLERTHLGVLRHSSFKGLRADKQLT